MLWVGDTLVRSYVFEDPIQQHITLSVVVDSTHFDHGDVVPVSFIAIKEDATTVSSSDTVVIKNRAWAWEFPAFAENLDSHTSEIVQQSLTAMGWATGEDHITDWDHVRVKQELSGIGVLYVGSHGTDLPSHWTAGISSQDPQGNVVYHEMMGETAIHSKSYRHFRMEQVGDYDAFPSLAPPPYNPSGVPQVTFAFMDSCESGENNAFARILYPGRIYDYIPPVNDPGPYAMNQAVLTWNGYIPIDKGARVNQELWERLEQGMTIYDARQSMIAENALLNRNHWLKVKDTLDGPYHPVNSPIYMPIWGDFYTRVTSVYTGDDSYAPNWWYL